jgi:hypothetical protein
MLLQIVVAGRWIVRETAITNDNCRNALADLGWMIWLMENGQVIVRM